MHGTFWSWSLLKKNKVLQNKRPQLLDNSWHFFFCYRSFKWVYFIFSFPTPTVNVNKISQSTAFAQFTNSLLWRTAGRGEKELPTHDTSSKTLQKLLMQSAIRVSAARGLNFELGPENVLFPFFRHNSKM